MTITCYYMHYQPLHAPQDANGGVTLTHTNYWIISVDSSTNPSQSQFNHFEDAEPLFRHVVPHSPVHAQSRANFIKLERSSQRPKICTETRDSVMKPAHTIGSCRSSPEVRSQPERSSWFSRPALSVLKSHFAPAWSSETRDILP